MKYLEMLEKQFPGKECSIEYCKRHYPYGIKYEVTIRVDDFYARGELGRVEIDESKAGDDTRLSRNIEHLLHLLQHEYEKKKRPGRDWSRT